MAGYIIPTPELKADFPDMAKINKESQTLGIQKRGVAVEEGRLTLDKIRTQQAAEELDLKHKEFMQNTNKDIWKHQGEVIDRYAAHIDSVTPENYGMYVEDLAKEGISKLLFKPPSEVKKMSPQEWNIYKRQLKDNAGLLSKAAYNGGKVSVFKIEKDGSITSKPSIPIGELKQHLDDGFTEGEYQAPPGKKTYVNKSTGTYKTFNITDSVPDDWIPANEYVDILINREKVKGAIAAKEAKPIKETGTLTEDQVLDQIKPLAMDETGKILDRYKYGKLVKEHKENMKSGMSREESLTEILNPDLSQTPSEQVRKKTTTQSGPKGKLTDPSIAKDYLKKAGGDKVKARELAKKDGWD